MLAPAGAQLTVTSGSYRYVASPTTAQLAVLRPDGSQYTVQLPGIATALFVHEAQLYVGFSSGDLQVFSVSGEQAAAPILALRHRYPHPVGGFALTNGQVVALPADQSTGEVSYGPSPPPSTPNRIRGWARSSGASSYSAAECPLFGWGSIAASTWSTTESDG
jgi:hypothetical protein